MKQSGSKLNARELHRPRQWGACWLTGQLWNLLDLDGFWIPRLPPSRRKTRWLNILKTLVCYRLISPGSEWRLHREWYPRSAMGDLLGEDLEVISKDKLYRCLDQLLPHKKDLFSYLTHRLRKEKLREMRRREGCYLLRSNLPQQDPAYSGSTIYTQLTEVEQAFKEIKGDLAIRPIYHQTDQRIEAHIFVAFLSYCLQVTLKFQAKQQAPVLPPRSILEKFASLQMVDVHLPTTDGRRFILSRYTQPDKDQKLLLHQLKLTLPKQSPPYLANKEAAATK